MHESPKTPAIVDLHDRLERHFKLLTCIRENTDFPIFTMEHGLSEQELKRLRSALQSRWNSQLFSDSDWLLWVIYATEVGYNYTGDEYWQSFEEQFPLLEYKHRHKIKHWFKKFQRDYNGVEPTGQWAEHFTIIAWPITHAILPKYLQLLFSRALYHLRFRLAGMEILNPRIIGQLLANNVHMPTTRFREFLQQEELIGRITLALLGENETGHNQPIYPQTLERIVADLDSVHSSREWRKETQRVVTDRFKGIGQGTFLPQVRLPYSSTTSTTINTKRFAIRPKVLLRHSGEAIWSVLLDIPSFRNMITLSADVHSFLKTTRCYLNGGNDTKPRGWLLSGNRRGVLQSWPDDSKPLIWMEHPHSTIDHLLEAECRLSPGPIWLFRINADGIARQVTTGTIRPGCNYVIVTTKDPPQDIENLSHCTLNCDGAKAIRLTMRDHVSVDLQSWISDLGLQVAGTVRVWPSGLPGRDWDGEGSSEWLTTETPILGFSHDYPVDAYTYRLNDDPEHLIQTDGTAEPIFIRLPCLQVGVHSLIVNARRSNTLDINESSSPAKGFIQLMVREPEPWVPGVTTHPSLIITIDPADPDLDMLWRNKTRLFVSGPKSYAVSITIELETADGLEILKKQVAIIDLPITPDKWQHEFGKFLNKEEHAECYLEAARGKLIIDGETLGNRSILFEHIIKPLRWLTRRRGDDILVRLIDDTGQEGTQAKAYRCDMECPLSSVALQPEKVRKGLVVNPPGSLFYAEHIGHSDSVTVSLPKTLQTFEGLGFSLKIDRIERKSHDILNALQILTRWQQARQSGLPIMLRHPEIVDGILVAIFESICGRKWAEAESNYRKEPKSTIALKALKSRVDKLPNFAESLLNYRSSIASETVDRSIDFVADAKRFSICDDSNLCEFALCLASQPHTLIDRPKSELKTLISQLMNCPATLRGARLLALLTTSNNETPVPILPRWRW